MTHELKVHCQFWEALASGAKPFEIRRNDRKFAVGDLLDLCEYDPTYGFTGARTQRRVTYILHAEDLPVALMPGYVALGIEPL